MASETPRPSQTRSRLLPSLARSVGFGPVWRPQKLPGSNCRPRRPATNQSPRSVPASPAKRSGSVARCPPLASHVTAASKPCPNRSPVPVAASPHGMPLRSTKKIPGRQARSGKRGLPPLGLRVRAAAAVESNSAKDEPSRELISLLQMGSGYSGLGAAR